MDVLGVCVGNTFKFENFCEPGILRSAEPSSRVILESDGSSIFAAYERILRKAEAVDDLGMLVLLHEDVEILDGRALSRLRSWFDEDPGLGMIGVAGGRNISSAVWWEAPTLLGRVFEGRGILTLGESRGDVDMVDGLFMAIRGSLVSSLSMDVANFTGWHVYDADLSFQVRKLGYRCGVRPLNVAHHTFGGVRDPEAYDRAVATFQAKWAVPRAEVRSNGLVSARGSSIGELESAEIS